MPDYLLSIWLLAPCHDAPQELYPVALLYETDPMPETDARQQFAEMTYETAMEGIENEGEPLLLTLDLPDGDGHGIVQQSRRLDPAPTP